MVRARSVVTTAALTALCAPVACSGKSSRHELAEGVGGAGATTHAGQSGTSTLNGGASPTAGGPNTGGAPVAGGPNAGGAPVGGRSGASGVSGSSGAPASGSSGLGGDAGRSAGGDGGVNTGEGGAGAPNTTGGAANGGDDGAPPSDCRGWTDDCGDGPECTPLDSAEHCGACGVPAPSFEHTLAVCTNETPSPSLCEPNFADCNPTSYDCETGYDAPEPNCLPAYVGSAVFASASFYSTASLLTPSGELYIAGYFWAPSDFDPGPGEALVQPNGVEVGFVTKFAPDGSYRFTQTFDSLSGSSSYVRRLALAPDGSLRVAGSFFGEVDLDPGDGAEPRVTSAEQGNVFVVALSADGEFLWGADLAATERSYVVQASVDSTGNTWLAGEAQGELAAAPGALGSTDYSGFVAKLNDTGNLDWIRVVTGDENCDAEAIGVVAEPSGAVDALVNVSGSCELHGTSVPALATTRETTVSVLFRFDENGEWLGAGVLEPADSSSSAHLWGAASQADGTLLAIGQLSGKTDFDPTDGVDFRGAWEPTGVLARFDAGELAWMQGVRGYTVGPAAPTPSGGVLLGAFGGVGARMAIFGFAPDSRARFTLGLGPNLEVQTLAANADGFVVVAHHFDGADLDPSPGTDVVSGEGSAILRFALSDP